MVKPSKLLALSAIAALISGPVLAQSGPEVGAIAGSLREQGSQISALIGVAAFVAGVGMAFAGQMKFWTMAKNPNDPSAKMSTAFTLMFVGGALAALPTVMRSGINTLFRGEGAGAPQLTNATSGFKSLSN